MGEPKKFPKVPLKVVCVKAEGQRDKQDVVVFAADEDASAVWDGYEFSTTD